MNNYQDEHRSRRQIVNAIRLQLPTILTQQETASVLGVSRRMVDQLEISALWKIRMRMMDKNVFE